MQDTYELFGTEYGFKFTINAQQNICAGLPGHDIKRLPDVLQGDDGVVQLEMIKMIVIEMNKGYNAYCKFVLRDGEDHAELDPDLLGCCDMATLQDLLSHVMAVINNDQTQTVQAEPVKRKNAKGAAKG